MNAIGGDRKTTKFNHPLYMKRIWLYLSGTIDDPIMRRVNGLDMPDYFAGWRLGAIAGCREGGI
jgi:hypothetical protein